MWQRGVGKEFTYLNDAGVMSKDDRLIRAESAWSVERYQAYTRRLISVIRQDMTPLSKQALDEANLSGFNWSHRIYEIYINDIRSTSCSAIWRLGIEEEEGWKIREVQGLVGKKE